MTHSGAIRNVFKRAVTAVVEKYAAADVDYEEIGVTIVVIVTRGCGTAKASALDSSFGGDIFKVAVASIPIQSIRLPFARVGGGGYALERAPIQEIQIWKTVIVIVEHDNARAIREQNIRDAFMAELVNEIDACLAGHILENIAGLSWDWRCNWFPPQLSSNCTARQDAEQDSRQQRLALVAERVRVPVSSRSSIGT